MSVKGGVDVVRFDIVKFFCVTVDVRKSVKLKTCVSGSAMLRGGTGSLPSPETSMAMWRKSAPVGVKGWGWWVLAGDVVKRLKALRLVLFLGRV